MPWLLDALLTRLAARLTPRVAGQLAALSGKAIERHLDEVLLPQLRASLSPELVATARERLLPEMVAAVRERLLLEIDRRADELGAALRKNPLVGSELYLTIAPDQASPPEDYMVGSIPKARDFLHPRFAEFCRSYGVSPVFHRKCWEWAFIHERLQRSGMLVPGKRGLGFGVGREWLPALFARAGVAVTATDTPSEDEHWIDSAQYGGSKEALFAPHIIDREPFDERVAFELCDMTQLPEHLCGYDFCWSSCAFEHLGTLQRGLDFVVASVERCLVPGGIACHTTELNLSSDEATIEAGRDVIYRHRDLLQLCRTLEERGHHVEPLRIESGDLMPDYLVDLPPYRFNLHLKLRIGDYVATSLGLVIRRGQ